MERFADVCTIIFVVAALLLGIFTETNWPKKHFGTWIAILCATLSATLISVVLVVLFGNADQMWTLGWLLFD